MNAAEYTKMFELEDRYWWFVARREVALTLLRTGLSQLAPNPRVLDVGCGTGVVSLAIREFATPTSLDFSALALEYSHGRGLTNLVQGDGTKLPFADESFDAIIGLDIFEHIQADELAFEEAFRTLKPGGVLVLSVPAFRFLWGPHDVALHHFRRYRASEVESKLAKRGFSVTKCSYSVFLLFPLVVLSRLMEKLRPGPAKASLPKVPEWMNTILIRLQSFEAKILRRIDLPWGSSVLAVAFKPHRHDPGA